ncbi:MAG TPA: GTP-binding protein [Planctomicrobium sp.]|nr:GTP-binding protein [Planctomicrobium sp.]
MAQRIRFILLGGFLGAGKTTTIQRLAEHYTEQGLNVGIVTNDQATDLVDTHSLRSLGYDVEEVTGACFCCHFNELIGRMEKLSAEQRPDVILAEPVGSCTDLVATVIQPLKQLFNVEFDIAPYGVILKPGQGVRILRGEPSTGFSPKAAYILEKQLEEADFILINRIDELKENQFNEISTLCEQKFPGTPILHISAKTGEGIDQLIEFLAQEGDFGRKILKIDYDIYATGTAELGWLNSRLTVTGEHEFLLDDVLVGCVLQLQTKFGENNIEPAHLKVIGLCDGFCGVANLISSSTDVELSVPSHCDIPEAEIIVNARVACDPAVLQELVAEAVNEVAERLQLEVEWGETQCFRPDRPVPTHRFA